jgi:hypothetical protein
VDIRFEETGVDVIFAGRLKEQRDDGEESPSVAEHMDVGERPYASSVMLRSDGYAALYPSYTDFCALPALEGISALHYFSASDYASAGYFLKGFPG